MNFQYNYNLRGSDRKPLIEAMSQVLGLQAVYQGAPSFAYTVGDYTVDRNGVLSHSSNIHPDFAAVLINDLQERGFVAEKVATDNPAEESATDEVPADEVMDALAENTATETITNEAEPEEIAAAENVPNTVPNADVPNKLTVEIPDTGFTLETRENLKKIIASKATLLEQALGTDDLLIVELDGKIAFPWFTLYGLEGEADAYSRLITAICNMAKNQKRVTATEKPAENAKYGMRLFLVRLGFIGDEYKTARKILLRNLAGNASWKSGHKPEQNTDAVLPPNPAEATVLTEQALATPLDEADITETEPQKENEGDESYDK